MKTFREHGIFLPSNSTGEVRAKCPKCTPTRKHKGEKDLGVNVEKGTWLCHHCGWSAGLNDPSDHEAASKTYSRPLFIYSTLSDDILKYFDGRGIHQGTLADNQISATGNAIRFPYFKGGICVNIKTRTLDKKFFQEKNPEPCFYRFDALAPDEPIIITEGEIDCLSLCETGFHNSTSVPNGAPPASAKNYSREFSYLESAEELFQQCDKVILAVDNDLPGKNLEQELARRIGVEKCYRVKYPEGCKDANDVLVNHGRHKLREAIESASPMPVTGIFSMRDIEDLIFHLYDQGERSGEPTGWPTMDQFYTVAPGQLTIVTGMPGSGKSTWIDALAVNLMRGSGWRFAVFSPENWPLQRHAQNFIEKLSMLPFDRPGYHKPRIARKEVGDMIAILEDRVMFIMPENEKMTVETVLDKARVCIYRYGVNGIIIDPWNEFDHEYGNLSETQYIAEQLGRIRRFARQNGAHIWLIAHPQKMTKDQVTGQYPAPSMYEISGSAHWKNKADVGICVHRPDMNDDLTEVYVQKVRFREIGKTGVVQFRYSRETGTYTDPVSRSMVGVAGKDRAANN